MNVASRATDVFINCAFDDDFVPSFRALVFAVVACGFRVRCAREINDASESRIDKIYRIIEQSRFGIHDLSRTELDKANGLPRFNMPFELGLFLAAKRFGGDAHEKKRCLAVDIEQHRYQKFISDLGGADMEAHGGDPRRMVEITRNWLSDATRRRSLPPTLILLDSYDRFTARLPDLAHAAGLDHSTLHYSDLLGVVSAWVKQDMALRAKR